MFKPYLSSNHSPVSCHIFSFYSIIHPPLPLMLNVRFRMRTFVHNLGYVHFPFLSQIPDQCLYLFQHCPTSNEGTVTLPQPYSLSDMGINSRSNPYGDHFIPPKFQYAHVHRISPKTQRENLFIMPDFK